MADSQHEQYALLQQIQQLISDSNQPTANSGGPILPSAAAIERYRQLSSSKYKRRVQQSDGQSRNLRRQPGQGLRVGTSAQHIGEPPMLRLGGQGVQGLQEQQAAAAPIASQHTAQQHPQTGVPVGYGLGLVGSYPNLTSADLQQLQQLLVAAQTATCTVAMQSGVEAIAANLGPTLADAVASAAEQTSAAPVAMQQAGQQHHLQSGAPLVHGHGLVGNNPAYKPANHHQLQQQLAPAPTATGTMTVPAGLDAIEANLETNTAHLGPTSADAVAVIAGSVDDEQAAQKRQRQQKNKAATSVYNTTVRAMETQQKKNPSKVAGTVDYHWSDTGCGVNLKAAGTDAHCSVHYKYSGMRAETDEFTSERKRLISDLLLMLVSTKQCDRVKAAAFVDKIQHLNEPQPAPASSGLPLHQAFVHQLYSLVTVGKCTQQLFEQLCKDYIHQLDIRGQYECLCILLPLLEERNQQQQGPAGIRSQTVLPDLSHFGGGVPSATIPTHKHPQGSLQQAACGGPPHLPIPPMMLQHQAPAPAQPAQQQAVVETSREGHDTQGIVLDAPSTLLRPEQASAAQQGHMGTPLGLSFLGLISTSAVQTQPYVPSWQQSSATVQPCTGPLADATNKQQACTNLTARSYDPVTAKPTAAAAAAAASSRRGKQPRHQQPTREDVLRFWQQLAREHGTAPSATILPDNPELVRAQAAAAEEAYRRAKQPRRQHPNQLLNLRRGNRSQRPVPAATQAQTDA